MAPLDLWLCVWFGSCADHRVTQSRPSGFIHGWPARREELLSRSKENQSNLIRWNAALHLSLIGWDDWVRLTWGTAFDLGLTSYHFQYFNRYFVIVAMKTELSKAAFFQMATILDYKMPEEFTWNVLLNLPTFYFEHLIMATHCSTKIHQQSIDQLPARTRIFKGPITPSNWSHA